MPAARKLLALNRQTSPGTGVIPENQDVEMILLQNGQTVPAACPGEIAGLNFGSCINYFFVCAPPSLFPMHPIAMPSAAAASCF